MKSKRSFFNGVLFAAELKRLRPLSCMYCIVLCVILSLRFSGGETAEVLRREAAGRMIEAGWPPLVIAAAVMAVVTAMVVFRHLYSHRDVAFICSLPLSRGAVYGSCFTAGFISMLAADVSVTAVWAVVEAIHGILNAHVLLFLLAMLILLDLTFYGFAVLCAMLTGSMIVLPLVWLVLEVTASAVSLMISGILRTLVFGFGESPLLSLRLSPLIWILECAPVYGPYFDGGPGMTLVTANVVTLAVYAALGIAFALLGLYLYRRRAMENAGEIVALPVLRPVFRWCMSLGCGLAFTWLYCMLRGNDTFCGTPAVTAWCVVFAALGAAVGWFGSEMLMKKTARVFRQKQPGVILSAAILAAGILCAGTGLFGYEDRIPDPADVETVLVSWSFPGFSAQDDETILLVEEAQRTLIAGRDDYAEAGADGRHGASSTGWISYSLRGGTVIRRMYTLYDPAEYPAMRDDIDDMEKALNADAAYEARKLSVPLAEDTELHAVIYGSLTVNGGWSKELIGEEAISLYKAVEQDLDAHDIGQTTLFADDAGSEEIFTIIFELYTASYEQDSRYLANLRSEVFHTSDTSLHTLSWLNENLEAGMR